jgi:glycogen(starch) synthase
MYPPHHLGGYEISCRDVMVRLAERGHSVTVLTSDFRVPGAAEPMDDTVVVHRDLRLYLNGDATALGVPSRRGRLSIERANQEALRRTLDESQPDVVSVWHLGATSMGLLTTLVEEGAPLVYAVCDDWLSYGPQLDPWCHMFRRRPRLARLARAVTGVPTTLPDVGASGSFCFVSELTRTRAIEHSGWHFPDSTVVFSGIDRALFPRPRQTSRPWQWRLLYAGRLDPRKGVETLLRAMTLLPAEATLTILSQGEAGYRERLQGLASELGLGERVAFDRVDREAMAQRYGEADVVVFPSEWEEPFGLVPLEAMACATPVVATGMGGSGEFLLDDVNCVLFTARDPAALAGAVMALAGDPGRRSRLSEAGLTTAGQFDVERLTDVFEAWHDAAASRFAGGRPPDRRLDLSGVGAATEQPVADSTPEGR